MNVSLPQDCWLSTYGSTLSVTRHLYFVYVPGYKTKPRTEKEGVVNIDIQDVGATKKTIECLIGRVWVSPTWSCSRASRTLFVDERCPYCKSGSCNIMCNIRNYTKSWCHTDTWAYADNLRNSSDLYSMAHGVMAEEMCHQRTTLRRY